MVVSCGLSPTPHFAAASLPPPLPVFLLVLRCSSLMGPRRSFDLSKQSSGDMPAAAMRALSSFAVIVSIVFLVASDEEEEGAEPYRS